MCTYVHHTNDTIMESFLSATKSALSKLSSYKRVRVVLGNETCDLDSAVSALTQAFCEYLDDVEGNGAEDLAVIPLMNVPEREYRVKTEVVFFLKSHNIHSDLMTFRDQIDLKGLKESGKNRLEVVLVDHHSLADEDAFLADSVRKIIDHRPRDARWPWLGREVHLESVGSCATLVAQNLFEKHPAAVDRRLSSLLRGPILIDTHNFSKEADRATPADVRVVEALENVGQLDPDRSKVLSEIVAAKADISQLTGNDLLIRDMKVVSGVPIVGLPMLVKNFLELQDALNSLESFAKSKGTAIVVLMGMDLKSQKVSRDIGIFSLAADRLRDRITEALTTSTSPQLDLTLLAEIRKESASFELLVYAQGNLRATRKCVLPIIRESIATGCLC